jgi:hypothetical protein
MYPVFSPFRSLGLCHVSPRTSCFCTQANEAFLAVLSFLFCPDYLILAFLCGHPFSGSPVLVVQSLHFCSACPLLPVLMYSRCPVPVVLFFLSSPSCPGLAVLFWQPCPGSFVRPVHYCMSSFSCQALPVLVLSDLFCVSCSACPVQHDLFCLSISASPASPVLVCLSCSVSSVLLVLFWLPFLAVLSFLSSLAVFLVLS